MTSPLGAVAAFGSSCTWAYASARYAIASAEVSPVRVNLVRMVTAWPLFVVAGLLSGTLGHGLTARHVGWLFVSTLCSYGFADSLFFSAARRIGVSSALAIASTYPLWAALKGTLIDHEPFGLGRASGTLLCIGGVIAIIKLRGDDDAARARDRWGVPLALVTSLLWAGNSISIKAASEGIALSTVNATRYAIAIALLSAAVLMGRLARLRRARGGSPLIDRAPGPRAPSGGWLRLGPAIVADSVVGSVIFIYGLRETDLAVGATLSSLAPLVSLPIAIRMGVERLSIARLVAVTVTVAGIALLAAC